MSATHKRSGASGVMSRFTRSGAGGVSSFCERTVVRAFLLRPPHSNNPAFRISRTTRFLAHLTPESSHLEVDPRRSVSLTTISVDTGYLLRKQGSACALSEGALSL